MSKSRHILYAVIVFIVFLPLILKGNVLSNGDIPRSHVYYMTYLRDSVREGRLPLWNPYIYLGQPFLANPSVAFWYPATWLFVVLPMQAAFMIHMMFHVWWSMAGMRMFLRGILGKTHETASWVGGLVFGLSGYSMAHVYAGHYDVLAAGSWIGWVLWAGRRHPALLALTLGMQLLSGYASMSLYTLMTLGVFWIFRLLSRRAIAGILLGFLIGAVQLLPNWEFMSRTVRTIHQGYENSALGSIEWNYFLQLLLPFPYGGIRTPYQNPEVGYWEQAMYVGITAAALAALGVLSIAWKKQRNLRPFIIAGGAVLFFSAWLSLGRFTRFDLYHLVWQHLPFFRMIRIPARFVFLIDAMMAALAAAGFGVIVQMVSETYRRAVAAAVIGLILIELVPFALTMTGTGQRVSSVADPAVAKILTTSLLPGERFNTRHPYDFGYDAAVGYRTPSVNGYDVTHAADPFLFERAALGLPQNEYVPPDRFQISAGHPVNRFLSVRYSLEDPKEYAAIHRDVRSQHKVGSGRSAFGQYDVIRNESILPLWYLAPRAASYATDEALYEAIRTGQLDYESTVGLVGFAPEVYGTRCTAINETAAEITSLAPEEVHMTVRTPCSGYLTGSQVYFPGWTAMIDDRPAPIYRGNLGFAALAMPEGEHTVVLRYRSTYLGVGMIVSVVSLVIVLVLIRGIASRRLSRDTDPV